MHPRGSHLRGIVRLRGRRVVAGEAGGFALVSKEPISFFGGVDPKSGVIIERGHLLEGRRITGRVLVFPYGKGSTLGSYTLYAMARCGMAPAAIINIETEVIIASGCALAGIALIDRLEEDPLSVIREGDYVKVHTDGSIEVERQRP